MLLTRLKYWREYQGLSLRQLAAKSKIPYSAISLLENGKREPQGRTVHKLAAALDVKITELYDQVQPAPVTIQPTNNNKTITFPQSKAPRTTRSKKTAAPTSSFWIFEKNQEESEPFRLDNQTQAERLQEKLGGQHQAKVYEAVKSSEAWHQHVLFLTRIAQDLDCW